MTDSQPIDGLSSMTNTVFADMTRAADGAGVEAQRMWQGVMNAKTNLEGDQSRVLAAIEQLHENKYMPEQERQARLRELADIGESARIEGVKRVLINIAAFEQTLHDAELSDLVLADAGDRTFIRQDIDSFVRGRTQGSNGQPLLIALTDLAKSNPGKYAAEVAEYGPVLLEAAGDKEFVPRLKENMHLVLGGTTPKSKAARSASEAMTRLSLKAHANVSLGHIAQQRLETALKPKPVTGFQFDILIPRR